jgi:hypothetical protein
MEELNQGIVFRLAVLHVSFAANSPHLTVAHLRPSPSDLKQAEETGGVPLLSVFDSELTTVEQACVIRNKPTLVEAFGWNVTSILAIGNEAWPQAYLVLRDRLAPPENDLPGADGHCGIMGLHPPENMPTRLFKEFRATLARLSAPLQAVTPS